MMYDWSIFGENLTRPSGIGQLMDDLGEAMSAGGEDILMLGGGQPALIPELLEVWQREMQALLTRKSEFDSMLGIYAPPEGLPEFRETVANLLKREFGWPVKRENILITNGGQSAFFFLFNSLAGAMPDGSRKQILLPVLPEYIGYADQSASVPLFDTRRARIEHLSDHEFKYLLDRERLGVQAKSHGAICVTRPTNPSSNVLRDDEVHFLRQQAAESGIPLIVDQAYGAPFPNVLYTPASMIWDENMVVTMSLSKFGLPGTRTGIVVAEPNLIRRLSTLVSSVSLANNNVGQVLSRPLLESGEALRLSTDVIMPYYRAKAEKARRHLTQALGADLPWSLHHTEGAFFLWLWLRDCPLKAQDLYQRLKQRGVLVIPGHHFFFGSEGDWQHRDECLRISYTMPDDIVAQGLEILAEEVHQAYSCGR